MYYIIKKSDKRCYGTADCNAVVPETYELVEDDKYIDNPHDYVLRDGALVYDPPTPKEVEK